MPDITVTDETYTRLSEFKQVVEAVVDEQLDFATCAETVLIRGMDSMLEDLIGSQEVSTLIASFQQIAARFPAQVYAFVAETLKRGASAQQQDQLRRKLGFSIPHED